MGDHGVGIFNYPFFFYDGALFPLEKILILIGLIFMIKKLSKNAFGDYTKEINVLNQKTSGIRNNDQEYTKLVGNLRENFSVIVQTITI